MTRYDCTYDGPRDTSGSLQHFGTVAFGIDLMANLIRVGDAAMRQVDAGGWFKIVPMPYRPAVVDAVKRALDSAVARSERLDEPGVRRLVADIHAEIWRNVEPVAPTEVSP